LPDADAGVKSSALNAGAGISCPMSSIALTVAMKVSRPSAMACVRHSCPAGRELGPLPHRGIRSVSAAVRSAGARHAVPSRSRV
jgi:hypothetical protein